MDVERYDKGDWVVNYGGGRAVGTGRYIVLLAIVLENCRPRPISTHTIQIKYKILVTQLLVASPAARIPMMSVFQALQSKEKWCVYCLLRRLRDFFLDLGI